MKIAQIVCVYPPYKGGIGTSALETARVFSSAGYEVETFTIAFPLQGGEKGKIKENGNSVIRLKAFPRLGKAGVLPFLCRRLKDFDVIYLHYPFFGTAEIVWFLKKFLWKKKKKLIIHYHMDAVLPNSLLKILSLPSALIFNSLFKEADLIVCASLDYAKNSRLENIYKKYSEKFVEITYGVDTEKFKPAAAWRRDEIFKILFVGGLDRAHYFKGVNILMDSLKLLSEGNSNWQAEIVGAGDLQAQYEKQARELGIADKVIFSGKASDEELPKKYQQADCLVLPSINKGEAFGIVLIEAMASGLPVIASDLPGVRGVFTSESGLIIKPGDAEDLKEKIKFLMENQTRRLQMGIAARKEAEEKYGQSTIGNKLKEIIRFL